MTPGNAAQPMSSRSVEPDMVSGRPSRAWQHNSADMKMASGSCSNGMRWTGRTYVAHAMLNIHDICTVSYRYVKVRLDRRAMHWPPEGDVNVPRWSRRGSRSHPAHHPTSPASRRTSAASLWRSVESALSHAVPGGRKAPKEASRRDLAGRPVARGAGSDQPWVSPGPRRRG